MSMAQSPTIAIPRKKTDDVDWSGPIRTIIAQSYGESPDTYATELAALQRCRQDAVKGAGSDATARDLLYKYFGQLELLELRFSEIRVVFPWHDAFTNKLTTQTSLAFEKASIIFQIAATHSAIAISQNRSDPEGLKRSFHYFKTSAGMLTYINENFLHAPSTDLSKEVIKFLTGAMLAQATEVFFEKLVEEKKSAALVAKVAAQAAYLYTNLTEEVKEFMGRGIFDRNWVKAKYFSALAQYHRSIADTTSGLHGDSLSRLNVAEGLAKEAHRLSQTFSSNFTTTLSPTLPPDAGSSMLDLTKTLQTLMTEKRTEAQRDNDLIYNAICPPEATLPVIEKLSVANPIPIQEVYGNPDVQKVIGPDLFAKLIPLSVHESASIYSEEKAKLVRSEAEKAEIADGEVRAALESMGLPVNLRKWKELIGGDDEESGVPREVEAWADEVTRGDGIPAIERRFAELEAVKRKVDQELRAIAADLEEESRECEMQRVKYDHLWEQEPSAGLTKDLRQELKSHREALTAASTSDTQVANLWQSVHPDLILLLAGNDALEGYFITESNGPDSRGDRISLLDVSDDAGGDDRGLLQDIKKKVDDIDERIGKLNKIKRERAEVLKDLKEKVQNDDVSHLLLLNRRSPNVEPSLFAAELEKFRPYQARLGATIQVQSATIDEISVLYKSLTSGSKAREMIRKADIKEKRHGDAIARLSRAKEGWSQTKETLTNGLQFYRDLSELVSTLRRNVASFVATRAADRAKIIAKAEAAKQAATKASSSSASAPPPALPPKKPASTGLENQFTAMKFESQSRSTPPPPPPPARSGSWMPPLSSTASPLPPPPPAPPSMLTSPVYGSQPQSPPQPPSSG
ncbi:bck1-like resistance to osmotic shock, partial [Tulasnella sp. 403]